MNHYEPLLTICSNVFQSDPSGSWLFLRRLFAGAAVLPRIPWGRGRDGVGEPLIRYSTFIWSSQNGILLGIRLKGNVGIEISIFGGKNFMLVAKAMCFMELFSTLTPASSCDTWLYYHILSLKYQYFHKSDSSQAWLRHRFDFWTPLEYYIRL